MRPFSCSRIRISFLFFSLTLPVGFRHEVFGNRVNRNRKVWSDKVAEAHLDLESVEHPNRAQRGTRFILTG